MKWQIPYAGKTWEFDDSRITASEARLQKRLCGGATPSVANASRFELDPDAIVAGLAIARRRAGLPVDEAIVIDDEELDLTAVMDATAEAAKGATTPTPEQDEAAAVVLAEAGEFEPAPKRTRKSAAS